MNKMMYSQSEIAKMQGWLGDMGRQILGRFDCNDAKQKALFPRLFARKAFAQGMVKFLPIAYVRDKAQYDLECFAQGLKNYLELAMSARLSRSLCDTLVLVINPRERFDVFAGDDEAGYAIRERIRKNIDHYNLISRSPLLGHYQLGELEWVQYMLPVTNDEEPMQCPLSFEKYRKIT